MNQQRTKQLQALQQACQELDSLRTQIRELESRRNMLIVKMRQAGARTGEIASICGLTPGRVTQIADVGR